MKPTSIQHVSGREMNWMACLNNTAFAALCVLRTAQIVAMQDAPTTVYSSRIDGCLLPAEWPV